MTFEVKHIEQRHDGTLVLHAEGARRGPFTSMAQIEISPARAAELLAALIGSVDTATLKKMLGAVLP